MMEKRATPSITVAAREFMPSSVDVATKATKIITTFTITLSSKKLAAPAVTVA
jgi:hypothetical protein